MSKIYTIEIEVEISLLGDDLAIDSITVDGVYVQDANKLYTPSNWTRPNRIVEDTIVNAAIKVAMNDDWTDERGKLYSDYAKEG